MERQAPRRWPRWVFGDGDEPDPRFTFANERTFLAWVSIALGLLAGGVALQSLPLAINPTARTLLALLFVLLALGAAGGGWVRWAQSERAMRHAQPLPGAAITGILVAGVTVAGVVLLVVFGLP